MRTPVGEIDLIARRGGVLACIEVKTRATAADLDLAIDRRRLERVAAAAGHAAAKRLRPGESVRIDVILLRPNALPRHIANVWTG